MFTVSVSGCWLGLRCVNIDDQTRRRRWSLDFVYLLIRDRFFFLVLFVDHVAAILLVAHSGVLLGAN